MSDELFRALQFRGPHEAKQVNDLATHLNTEHGGGPVEPVVNEVKRKPMLKKSELASDNDFIAELQKRVFGKNSVHVIDRSGANGPNIEITECSVKLSESDHEIDASGGFLTEGLLARTLHSNKLNKIFEDEYKKVCDTALKVGDKVLVTKPKDLCEGPQWNEFRLMDSFHDTVCTVSKLNVEGNDDWVELNGDGAWIFDMKWLTKQEDFSEFGAGLGLATTKPEGKPNWQIGEDCILNKPEFPCSTSLTWVESLDRLDGLQFTIYDIHGTSAKIKGNTPEDTARHLLVSLDWLTRPVSKEPAMPAINEYNTILMQGIINTKVRVYFDTEPHIEIRDELTRAGFSARSQYWVGQLNHLPVRYDNLNVKDHEYGYTPEFPSPF